jgi:serine/threonine protein kinase
VVWLCTPTTDGVRRGRTLVHCANPAALCATGGLVTGCRGAAPNAERDNSAARLGPGRIIRHHMSLQPGTRLGPYEVLSLIGAGGMGEVYRARDTRLGREVAIKVLPADRVSDADRRRRFVQEAQAASALNHPHIIT